MRRLALTTALLAAAACGPKTSSNTTPPPNVGSTGPDAKSGPDGKRSGAKELKTNTAVTDEVTQPGGDKTDWWKVELKGKSGVLAAQVNWDQAGSDIMIDVFDDHGAQISASPVRGKGEQAKKLLTQIDKPGTYYIRITAPNAQDASVYTLEAKWDEPPPPPPPPPVVENTPPPPQKHHHEQREPRETKPPEGGPTLQGRVVQAYRDGEGMMMQIDKGSEQGVRVGMPGSVLSGPSGEDAIDGGNFRVTSVLGPSKCLAKTSMKSLGRNNRVMITLSK
jgi:hypothetical protein